VTALAIQSTQVESARQIIEAQQKQVAATQTASVTLSPTQTPLLSIARQWSYKIPPYYGSLYLTQNRNMFSGTLEDYWEGTYGDKLVDGKIDSNFIRFTRVGRFGIQYWQGVITDNNGILIINGQWRKEGWTEWQTFYAEKKK
jgi:hypothetical protein